MGDYRVLVTGSREYRRSEVLRELSLLAMEHGRENLVIVHGAHRSGADALARLAARALGIREEPHPADWKRWTRSRPDPQSGDGRRRGRRRARLLRRARAEQGHLGLRDPG